MLFIVITCLLQIQSICPNATLRVNKVICTLKKKKQQQILSKHLFCLLLLQLPLVAFLSIPLQFLNTLPFDQMRLSVKNKTDPYLDYIVAIYLFLLKIQQYIFHIRSNQRVLVVCKGIQSSACRRQLILLLDSFQSCFRLRT